jgi:hypothetical protein
MPSRRATRAELKAKGMASKATEQPVNTGTAAGKAFLDMLGVFCRSMLVPDQPARAVRARRRHVPGLRLAAS